MKYPVKNGKPTGPGLKVLVTGGAGFIGSHLVDALIDRGDTVFVIDNLSTGRIENLGRALASGRLFLERQSLQASERLSAWISEADCVYHLAARVGVRHVIGHQIDTITSIVHTTELILEHAAQVGVPTFIASTSEVYGKSAQVPFTEDQPIQLETPGAGRWCYAASKAMGEFIARAYARERELPVVIGRLFNAAGPRQRARFGMVIPTFVDQALRGAPITVYGTGQQSRSFVHVADIVRAMVGLMEAPAARGEIVNIGNDRETKVITLAERIKALTGSPSPIVCLPYEQVYADYEDMPRRVPDLRKLKRLTGFQPSSDLDEILLSVIEARSRHLHGHADMLSATPV